MAGRRSKTTLNAKPTIDKVALVRLLREAIASREETLLQAAASAREAATHEETQPETDKDTFALESSYLAGAQAARARELAAVQKALQFMPLRKFGPDDPIGLSAVIDVELGDKRSRFFFSEHGGGIKLELDGVTITVVTPEAPMGLELFEKRAGDEVELNRRRGEILAVY